MLVSERDWRWRGFNMWQRDIWMSCYFLGVAVIGGLVYAVGGFNGSLRVRTVDVYEPMKDVWSSIPSMEARRSTLGAAVLNGLIYAVGGFDGSSGTSNISIKSIKSSSSFMFIPCWPQSHMALHPAHATRCRYVDFGRKTPYHEPQLNPIYFLGVCERIRNLEPAMQRKKILFPTDWLEASIIHSWEDFDTVKVKK